ncbi:hypothetical protein T02_10885 [Trichinella nativa]|uniref:Uncharacterized protein n=1 Tax=Trichinella nativa TaxID=6335 RepID=A0A0V1LFC4_9BILA|nr:hypothetical protein T02_10885 [Trichinella nativa]
MYEKFVPSVNQNGYTTPNFFSGLQWLINESKKFTKTWREQNKRKNRTTYGELLNRIYGNRAVDSALQSGPQINNRYQHNDSKSKPYVTYPNDPHNYYTLNGTSRLNRGPGSSVTSQGR